VTDEIVVDMQVNQLRAAEKRLKMSEEKFRALSLELKE